MYFSKTPERDHISLFYLNEAHSISFWNTENVRAKLVRLLLLHSIPNFLLTYYF